MESEAKQGFREREIRKSLCGLRCDLKRSSKGGRVFCERYERPFLIKKVAHAKA